MNSSTAALLSALTASGCSFAAASTAAARSSCVSLEIRACREEEEGEGGVRLRVNLYK